MKRENIEVSVPDDIVTKNREKDSSHEFKETENINSKRKKINI